MRCMDPYKFLKSNGCVKLFFLYALFSKIIYCIVHCIVYIYIYALHVYASTNMVPVCDFYCTVHGLLHMPECWVLCKVCMMPSDASCCVFHASLELMKSNILHLALCACSCCQSSRLVLTLA